MTRSFVGSVFEFIDNSTRVTDPRLHECVEGLNSRGQFVLGQMARKLGRKAHIRENYIKEKSIKKNYKFLLNAALE